MFSALREKKMASNQSNKFSVLANADKWPQEFENCASANIQSHIDLSISKAKTCNSTCEFIIDTNAPPITSVSVWPDGTLFQGNVSSVTATYKGSSISLEAIRLYSPSQHTWEGHRYDAELMLMFSGNITVSIPVQSSSRRKGSTDFFAIYASLLVNAASRPSPGKNWNVLHAFPSEPSYFAYDGTEILPSCERNSWVVFRFPINISPDDLADIQRNSSYSGAYRPVQPLGNRTVWFNDGSHGVQSEETLNVNGNDRMYVVVKRIHQDAEERKRKAAQPEGMSVPVLFGGTGPSLSSAAAGQQKTWMTHARETHEAVKAIGWKNAVLIPALCLGVLALMWVARKAAQYVLTHPSGGILTNVGWLRFIGGISIFILWPWKLIKGLLGFGQKVDTVRYKVRDMRKLASNYRPSAPLLSSIKSVGSP
jgi:carbonic anhydrase